MKKNYKLMSRLASVFACVTISFNASAQLTGIKSIPGDYITVSAAVTDLNAQGVGPGGAIFNIAPGYTETITAPISITATGSAADPIVFQRDGMGANPVITAHVGTATPTSAVQDGIWNLVGSDYVSIYNIDLSDPNTTNPATMEYGFALFKQSAINGCQNNIIQGCNISLSRNNNATGAGPSVEGSKGINLVNATAAAQATTLTVTSAGGSHSNNKFYNNTIQNCNYGIVLIGYADASPFANADMNNEIGGSISTGNIIQNFGGATGATNPSAGIRTLAQYGLLVTYNTVNNNNGSGVNHVSTLRGIYINTATSASVNITYNTVTVNSGATTSLMQAISNVSGSTAAGNTVNISNNLVQNCTYTAATSGDFNAIINTGTAATVNVSNNTVSGNTLAGTGAFTGIDGGGGTNVFVNGNTVINNTKTGASGILYSIRGGTSVLTIENNIINNNGLSATSGSSSGTVVGIYSLSSPTAENFNNNSITNLYITGSSTSTASAINGIQTNSIAAANKVISGNQINSLQFNNSSTGAAAINGITTTTGNNVNLFKNKIYNLLSTGSGSSVSGVRVVSGTTVNISNNLIGDLKTPSASASNPLNGINITGGTTVNVYYNTVQINNTSTGTDFGSSGITASTTPTVELRNNIFLNGSTPNGTGLTVVYRRTTSTLTTYSSASNNNIYYAGTPSATNLIYYDGTNSDQTLGAFQARVALRDANSRTENVSFVSTSGSSSSFLHVNTATPSFAESGAANIATFTTDYDNDIRQGNPGYTGTGTSPDIGADEFEGTPVPMCSGTPAAGNITGVSAVCAGTGTILNLSGASTDPGVAYQWASSTTAGGPYVNMGTGLSQATGNITVPTYYIVTTTCSFSGLFASTSEFTLNINSNPSVSVTPATATICSGGSPIALTASGASTYSWSPSSGLSATTGGTVNASPSGNATYTVTGTDGNGCTGTASAMITYAATPIVSSVTATPSTICSGANSQLMVTSSAPAQLYNFIYSTGASLDPMIGATTVLTTGNDDNVTASAANIGFTFGFAGTNYTQYSVSPDGWISLGGAAASNQYTNAVTSTTNIPKLYPYWDDLATGTTGNVQVLLTGTAPNRIFIVQWFVTVPRNTTGAANSTFQAWLYEGSNKIEYRYGSMGPQTTGSASGGLTASATAYQSITFSSNTVSTISANDNNTGVPTSGTMYTFSVPAYTYSWSPATFLTSTTIENPMANNVTSSTTYSVTVSNGSCSSTGSVTLTAGSLLSSSATITPGNTVCEGTNVTLNSVASGGGAPYTYSWSGPNGFSSNLQNPALTGAAPAASGTYTVTITDNCAATSAPTVTLTVNPNPAVTVSPSASTFCAGGTAIALTANGASTYSWLPATGLSSATGASVNASPSASFTYTVTGTDANGCIGSATTSIASAPAVTLTTVSASPSAVCEGSNSNLLAVASIVTSAYCTASATSTSFEKISNVTIGNINNASNGSGGYENFTAMSTNITAGAAVPFSIGVSSAYAGDDRIHIWIDLNNDGSFTGAQENVYNGAISTFCPTCAGSAATVTGSITIPVTAYNGATRMRVRLQDQSATTNNSTPCGVSQYGQVEDYTVNINGGTDNVISYAWSPSTFLNSTSISNPIASNITAPNTYSVTATSLAGCSTQGSVSVSVNPLPTVTAMSDDADNTICAGSSVTLNGGGASSYSWTGSVTNNTAFTPSATDTYTVTGTDVNGCVNTATVTITVNPLPVVALGADFSACVSATLDAGNAGAAYLWSDASTSQTLTVNASGTYSVTVTDAVTSCTGTDAIDVTINPLPVVALGADIVQCGGTVTLDAGNAGASYLWSDASTSQTLMVSTSGTYSVTVTDGVTSCTGTDAIDVTINPLPVVALGTDIVQCGGTVTLDAGNAGASYLWSDASTSQTLAVSTSGTYSVTVTDAVTSCTGTDEIDVTINPLPVVALGTDIVQCGGTVTLDAGNAGASYLWNDASTSQTLMVSTSGTYNVTVTDAITSCTGTDAIDVTINPLPAVAFTPFAVPVCDNGGPVSLSGGSPAGGVYSGTGVSGTSFDPTGLSGMVLLTYTVTDANSCTNSDTASITVDLCSGIASANSISEFNVYPNPANGMINVSITNVNAEVINISIADLQGKEVYNSTNTNVGPVFTKQINIESLAKGVYYVKLSTENAMKINKLIVH